MASQKTTLNSIYRFRLANGDIEFEVEGDRQFVIDLATKYAPAVTAAVSHKQSTITDKNKVSAQEFRGSEKSLSIREFIRSFDLKRHTDYVLAFGYFLEKHMGQESFTPADINSLYYEAKLEGSNTSQMLLQNIKQGYVMEAKGSEGTRKRYILTTSGERHVEQKRLTGAE